MFKQIYRSSFVFVLRRKIIKRLDPLRLRSVAIAAVKASFSSIEREPRSLDQFEKWAASPWPPDNMFLHFIILSTSAELLNAHIRNSEGMTTASRGEIPVV